MADNLIFQVNDNFNLDEFAQKVIRMGHARGYMTTYASAGGIYFIDFNDGNEGFTKYIGMGANIRLTLLKNGMTLHANFTDADWIGKVVAYCLSSVTCGFALIPGIIGTFKQLDFPKKIGNELYLLLNDTNQPYYSSPAANPFASSPAQGAYPPPPTANTPPTQPPPSGAQPEQQKFCTTCGAELREGSQFCTQCGSKNTNSI
ncbi:MAG: zinc ribbon domain-containing protein [Oscillospiraceae bacterium]|jgi:hypothetical protein|nr:zinc ribbon domain-containing protein [Oscillospiraceae bacterium]